MRCLVIVGNLVAAAGFIICGVVMSGSQSANVFPLYHEFVTVGAVDEAALSAKHYDMPRRAREMLGASSWFIFLGSSAALACVANAIAVYYVAMRKERHEPNQKVQPTADDAVSSASRSSPGAGGG